MYMQIGPTHHNFMTMTQTHVYSGKYDDPLLQGAHQSTVGKDVNSHPKNVEIAMILTQNTTEVKSDHCKGSGQQLLCALSTLEVFTLILITTQ